MQPLLHFGVGRIARDLEAHADLQATAAGIVQALGQQSLGAADRVLAALGLGDRPRAEVRAEEEVAAAEAELLSLHPPHATPAVVTGGRQWLAVLELAVPRIDAERLTVVGVEAHKVHPHLRHLVEEVTVVISVPGRRAVEEIVPGETAARAEYGHGGNMQVDG